MKQALVIGDWDVVASIIWQEFQDTGVSKDVADVLIESVYEKLIKEPSVSPGNLLAEVTTHDLKPAKPEDVTVSWGGVLKAIEECCEMAPGKGVPNKISVRVLLGILDGLDKYPVPQEDKPFAEAQDKPDYKAMIEDLEIDFSGVYAFQLAARSARLKDILKKVRAEHTPKSEKPEVKDEENKT